MQNDLSYQFDKQLRFNNYISPTELDESLVLSALSSFSCKVLIQICVFSFQSRENERIHQSLELRPSPDQARPQGWGLCGQPNPGPAATLEEAGGIAKYLRILVKCHCGEHTLLLKGNK